MHTWYPIFYPFHDRGAIALFRNCIRRSRYIRVIPPASSIKQCPTWILFMNHSVLWDTLLSIFAKSTNVCWRPSNLVLKWWREWMNGCIVLTLLWSFPFLPHEWWLSQIGCLWKYWWPRSGTNRGWSGHWRKGFHHLKTRKEMKIKPVEAHQSLGVQRPKMYFPEYAPLLIMNAI